MKYFCALKINAMVHRAVTRLHMDQVVQIDLTRDEVFKKYEDAQELLLFQDKELIKEHIRKGIEGAVVRQFKAPLQVDSSDEKLKQFYAEVSMVKEDVLAVYQLEVDEAALGKTGDGITITKDEKMHAKLLMAIVERCSVFLTDEFAEQQKKPVIVDLIDHVKLSRCEVDPSSGKPTGPCSIL